MLQLTKTSISGVTVVNAIHKITSITLDCNGSTSYQMAMLINATAIAPIEVLSFSFPCAPTGGNIFDQCYAHALTLPDYAGAVII